MNTMSSPNPLIIPSKLGSFRRGHSKDGIYRDGFCPMKERHKKVEMIQKIRMGEEEQLYQKPEIYTLWEAHEQVSRYSDAVYQKAKSVEEVKTMLEVWQNRNKLENNENE